MERKASGHTVRMTAAILQSARKFTFQRVTGGNLLVASYVYKIMKLRVTIYFSMFAPTKAHQLFATYLPWEKLFGKNEYRLYFDARKSSFILVLAS